jgi:hypothetical protein
VLEFVPHHRKEALMRTARQHGFVVCLPVCLANQPSIVILYVHTTLCTILQLMARERGKSAPARARPKRIDPQA